MNSSYRILPELMVRAPACGVGSYDPDQLPEMLRDSRFRDALWLASPGFFDLLAAKDFEPGRLSAKEWLTLQKYFNRMCFRAVPFGAFASFTLTAWNRVTDGQATLDSRLHLLAEQGDLWKGAQDSSGPFALNPTLYRLGRQFRFIRSAPDAQGKFSYTLDALVFSRFTAGLIRFLQGAGKSREVLLAHIRTRSGGSPEESSAYLDFLIRSQVVYGPGRCALITGAEEPPAAALYGPSGIYAALERPQLHIATDTPLAAELQEALRVLQRLALPAANEQLEQFISAFRSRFDRQRVPLLEALDPDAGIVYGGLLREQQQAPVLQDIPFPSPPAGEERLAWTPVHRLLLGLWAGGEDRGSRAPLVLTDALMEKLKMDEGSARWPATVPVMFRRTEEHLLIEQAGGATGVSLAGRFSLFSPRVHRFCRQLAALEEALHPGAILADISLLADLHVDNINRRKAIYTHFIPLNVYAAGGDPACLPPSDLLLSVREGELVLESLRLGRRVLPRLSTAYNFKNNDLAIFRLLGDLQYQNLRAGLGFSLEALFPGQDFYPRVCYGRTVLSLATWSFSAGELATLPGSGTPGEYLSAVRVFRARHGLPQRISAGYHDQQLVFDLADPAIARFFCLYARDRQGLRVQEYLLPDRSVRLDREVLAGQFIAFFALDPPRASTMPPLLAPPPRFKARRRFPPGGPWVYVILYCTPLTVATVLTGVVAPVLRRYRAAIHGWFFVRYQERGHHLRLRVLVRPGGMAGEVQAALYAQLASAAGQQLVSKVQADTYDRELERYAPLPIESAEALFFAGSELLMAALQANERRPGALDELSLGLLSAYRLALALLGEGAALQAFLAEQCGLFTTEYRLDKPARLALDLRYRAGRPLNEALLDTGYDPGWPPAVYRAFRKFIHVAENLGRPGAVRLADLIHMQLNRSFTTDQRRQEMVVYYFLDKYTRSRGARKGGV